MGSVRKLPDGRWQAQFRPIPGGKQVTRTVRRRTDAQHWLDEQKALVVTGHFADREAGKITFGAYYQQWSQRQLWVPGTRKQMDFAARSVTFWDTPLRLVRRSHVEIWVKTLQTTHHGNGRGGSVKPGLAATTIWMRYKCVRTVLRAAIADKRITEDPSAGVKVPRVRRAAAAMTLPTLDQVRSLITAASPDFQAFVALCAFAGLRAGEAVAIKVGDIDLTKHILTVHRQAQLDSDGTIEVRAPKYGSERKIPLSTRLETILSTHIKRLAPDDKSWLFPDANGRPLAHWAVHRRWQKAKRAAIIEGVRLHDLRHFFASGLIGSGCDVVTTQHLLGHSSPTVTLGVYAHLWSRSEDQARQAIDAMVADVFR